MKRRLFVAGDSSAACLEFLRSELGWRLSMAGGFLVETHQDENGRLLSCALLPAAAGGGVQGFEALPFLDYTVSPPLHDTEVFRGPGVKLLEEAAWYPFCMLGELGGFELLVPQFRKELEKLFNSSLPVIGTLKSREEARELKKTLGLGDRFLLNVDQLWRALEADEDTLILAPWTQQRESIVRILRQWLREYAE